MKENSFLNKVLNVLKKIGRFLLDLALRVVYVFRDLGIAIAKGVIGIGKWFVSFGKRFADGSIWTKLSHFIMGIGNIARKQFIKGFIFLALQILFIVFMVTSPVSSGTPMGAKAVEGFFTLGDYHGMPVDTNYDFQKEYIGLIELPTGGDFNTEFREDISKIYRISNVLDAVEDKEIAPQKHDNRKNDKGKVIYNKDTYSQVLYDNRFDTNDYYAYQTYDLDENITLKVQDKSLVWITSSKQIDNEIKKAISLEKESLFGLYVEETDDGYRYLIISKATGKGDTLNLSAISSDVKVTIVDYDVNYVEIDIDFSLLMLLFGVITFAIIAVFLIIYNLNIASSYKTDKDLKEGVKPTNFLQDLKSLLDSRFHITLLVPAIIFLVVFTVVPTIVMIMIAFTDMSSNSASSGQILINWTGFANFVELFAGSSSGGSQIANEVGKNFASVLTWTFEWALLATFTCYFGGIFLALLINKKEVKAKKLWRTIFILTIAIPQFITLLVLRNLLSGNGPINTMLKDIGLISESINFLQFGSAAINPGPEGVWLARITVLVINLYIGIPYTMLMTSGILMNIPKDLYEAATIDGANKWQMFRKITLPYVIFVTTPYLISSFIGNITSFNTIFLTTGGGPSKGTGSIAGHTDLLVTWLYKLTMEDSKYNAGSIIGILTFLITAFITLVCYRNSKAYKEEDTFQ